MAPMPTPASWTRSRSRSLSNPSSDGLFCRTGIPSACGPMLEERRGSGLDVSPTATDTEL
jgi:hypothetical protein